MLSGHILGQHRAGTQHKGFLVLSAQQLMYRSRKGSPGNAFRVAGGHRLLYLLLREEGCQHSLQLLAGDAVTRRQLREIVPGRFHTQRLQGVFQLPAGKRLLRTQEAEFIHLQVRHVQGQPGAQDGPVGHIAGDRHTLRIRNGCTVGPAGNFQAFSFHRDRCGAIACFHDLGGVERIAHHISNCICNRLRRFRRFCGLLSGAGTQQQRHQQHSQHCFPKMLHGIPSLSDKIPIYIIAQQRPKGKRETAPHSLHRGGNFDMPGRFCTNFFVNTMKSSFFCIFWIDFTATLAYNSWRATL